MAPQKPNSEKLKMTHKAFEILGERVYIRNESGRHKVGIFQESYRFQTTAEGTPRPALDFIEPIYKPNPKIEELAKGRVPRERINPTNPILSLHCGVDHLKLKYAGKRGQAHLFEGKLEYAQGAFFNDGNFEVYDNYKSALKRVGFKVE